MRLFIKTKTGAYVCQAQDKLGQLYLALITNISNPITHLHPKAQTFGEFG